MRDEVRSFAGVSEVAGYDRFVAWITRLYDIEFDASTVTCPPRWTCCERPGCSRG